ncbi:MAG: DUF1428 family protein [Actinomycetota bacterium]
MYTLAYLFQVEEERVDDFLRIQRQASRIYLEHGALDDETLAPADETPRYGLRSFRDALDLPEGSRPFIGLARFRDEAHHDEVMALVDADPRIDDLFAKMQGVIRISEVAFGDFARVI